MTQIMRIHSLIHTRMPPTALASVTPEQKMTMRMVRSSLRYHRDRNKIIPGKNPAIAIPSESIQFEFRTERR